jgi:hypothetical protein
VPSSSRGIWLVIVAALFVFVRSEDARAAEPAPHVEVVLGGPEAEADAMQAVLDELLGRLDVAHDFARTPGIDPVSVLEPREGDAAIRVWLELRRPERATCFIADQHGERILIRHLTLEAGLDEVAREQLGHIVESSVQALLEGGEIGVSRTEAAAELGVSEPAPPPPPPAPEPPAPPPAREPATAGWVGLGYQAQFWGGPVPAYHGPALAGGVRARAGARPRSGLAPGAMFSAQWMTPTAIESEEVALRLQGAALRAMATLRPRLADLAALHVAFGGGVDVVRVAPEARPGSPLDVTPAYTTAFPQGQAEVGLIALLPRGLELHFAALAGVDLIDAFYFVEGDSGPVFDPWIVRPGLRIGLAWDSGR